jgi:hypothetical protein
MYHQWMKKVLNIACSEMSAGECKLFWWIGPDLRLIANYTDVRLALLKIYSPHATQLSQN